MDQKRIDSFLRKLRTEKDLTQEQLAEKLNVSGRTVSRWENGNNMPDLSIIVELADFYDIDIRELLNGERKSEKMNEDLKETLEAVAEYSAAEKKKLTKELTTYTAGSAVSFGLLVIITVLNLTSVHSAFQIMAGFLAIMGLVFSTTSVVKLRQLKGKIIMNKNHFKNIIIGMAIGAAIGSLIGAMGYYGIIPRELRELTTYATIKICIGLIILIVDLFCVWGLIKPIIGKHIDKNGESETGIIESVRTIPHPKHLSEDEWSRPSRFACVVSYNTDKGKITKEFPPTPLTSECELYPFSFEEGNEIPIKYLKNHPKLSIINNERLKAAYKAEHSNDIIHLVMIPTIITALYIIAIIMI